MRNIYKIFCKALLAFFILAPLAISSGVPQKVQASEELYTLKLRSKTIETQGSGEYRLTLKNVGKNTSQEIKIGNTGNLSMNLPEGDYELYTKEVPKGYRPVSAQPIQFSVPFTTADGTTLSEFLIDLKLEKILRKVLIQKLDKETEEPLAGAMFNIARGEEVLKEGLVTNEKGLILLEDVEPGEYSLIETVAPEGYILPEDDIVFAVLEEESEEPVLVTIFNQALTGGSETPPPAKPDEPSDKPTEKPKPEEPKRQNIIEVGKNITKKLQETGLDAIGLPLLGGLAVVGLILVFLRNKKKDTGDEDDK